MNQGPMPSNLTPEAARYLDRMRSLERPIDLVDRIMAEVGATPQLRSGFAALPRPVIITAAVAAVLVAVALLLQFGRPNVGPQPTQVPSGQLPSAGTVLNRFPTISTYKPTVVGHGFLWMEDEVRGELIRVDLETGTETAIDIIHDSAGGAVRAMVDETSVWVVDGATSELVEIDPESAEEVRRIRTRVFGGVLAVGGGVAWLANGEAKELVRLNLATGEVDLRVPLEAAGVFLIDGDSLWVGGQDGALTRVNAATGAVEGQAVTRVSAFKLFRVGDAVLVYGSPFGSIVSVDVGSMEVTARYPELDPSDFNFPMFTDLAAGDGRLWAAIDSGQLVELDPTSLQPLAALSLDLTEVRLAYGAGAIWAVGADTSGNGVLLQIDPTQ